HEAQGLELAGKPCQRSSLRGRDAAAADQRLCQGDGGVGRGGHECCLGGELADQLGAAMADPAPWLSRMMIFCQIFCDSPAAIRSISLTASVTTGSGKPCANRTANLEVSDSISEQ